MNTPTEVALILWNPDVIQLVSCVLIHRNLKSCGLEPSAGAQCVEDLIETCHASVIVFDLDPPYERSAQVVLGLLDRFPDRSFVMTCADAGLVLQKAPWISAYPMFQKPYEMDEMANTVRLLVSAQTSVSA